jgi:hypothetical protein
MEWRMVNEHDLVGLDAERLSELAPGPWVGISLAVLEPPDRPECDATPLSQLAHRQGSLLTPLS